MKKEKIMFYSSKFFLSLCILGILASAAFSHTRFINPPKRVNDNLKVGPCGGVSRGEATTVTAGDTLPLVWEEFINHPGWFTVYFSTGDENQFEEIVEVIDTLDTPSNWEYRWEIPMEPCDNCILQVIQTMTNTDPPTFYYSCADIVIEPGVNSTESIAKRGPNLKVEHLSSEKMIWVNFPEEAIKIQLLDSKGKSYREVSFSEKQRLSSEVYWQGPVLARGIYYLHVIGADAKKLKIIQLNY